MVTLGSKPYSFFDSYSGYCNRENCKRYFVVNTDGDWNALEVDSLSDFSDRAQLFVNNNNNMITNLQILTDENEVIHATLDGDKRIVAAYQNVRRIPNALLDNYGHWVEIVDLSHNKLRDVDELCAAYRLHTLILDHNLISSDSIFPWMSQLQVLWLNNNLISDVEDFIPGLSRTCPNLEYLSLMGNAAASSAVTGDSEMEQEKYRLYVISYFDNLRHLDDKPVTTIERLRCRERTMKDNLLSIYYDMKTLFNFNFGKRTNSVV